MHDFVSVSVTVILIFLIYQCIFAFSVVLFEHSFDKMDVLVFEATPQVQSLGSFIKHVDS